MKTKFFFIQIIALSIILIPMISDAQSGSGGNGNGGGTGNGQGTIPKPADLNNDHGWVNPADNKNNGVNNKANVPIDGGLGLLIGAGVAYTLRRAYNRRKKIN